VGLNVADIVREAGEFSPPNHHPRLYPQGASRHISEVLSRL